MDPLDPGGHGFQAGFHLLGVEEIVVAEPQLEPVDGVVLQHFLDESETLVLHFPVFEVQLPRAGKALVQVAPGSNFQVPVFPGEIGRANVPFAVESSPPVEPQGRIEEQPVGAGVVAHDAQGILSRFQHHLGVLVGPAEDQVRPLLDRISPELADLGLVENRAPVSQPEHQGVDRSSQHFVHRGLELLLLHGRFIHVDSRMASVVIKHDPGFLSAPVTTGSGGRPPRARCRRHGRRGQTGSQGCFHELASDHRKSPCTERTGSHQLAVSGLQSRLSPRLPGPQRF